MNSYFSRQIVAVLLSLMFLSPTMVRAYPLDGYSDTGIRRTEGARLANAGIIADMRQPPGALLTTKQVDLRLLGQKDFQIPALDPVLSGQIKELLGEHSNEYSVAVLDLTDINSPRYAVHRGDQKQNVGSVGKILVALGIFQALADIWPGDNAQRIAELKNTIVTADRFSQPDHHTIRIFDLENKKLIRKTMQIGDQGSQWEFLDWMLSASSNAAAAMNQRQGMLMIRYGKDFQPSETEIQRFFTETPATEKTAIYRKTFWEPVSRNGLDIEQLRQGSFFTQEGKRQVNGGGDSFATANQLLELLVKMEQGKLVDEFSSRQLKRLLYMTERRIRYASSPALANSAVYYKSGSLYSCRKEEGFKCGKYKGNVRNYLNSVSIIESPPEEGNLYYMVIVFSNILRKNSAVDHQSLATRIHRLIQKNHPVAKE